MDDVKPNNTQNGKNRYMATVKIGTKGQIIIPQKARELFHLKPGDLLLIRADSTLGIAIQPLAMVNDLFDDFFAQHLNNL